MVYNIYLLFSCHINSIVIIIIIIIIIMTIIRKKEIGKKLE